MSRVDTTLHYLQRRGFGRRDRSRGWLWVGVAALVIRRVRVALGREPILVYRGRLTPGQSLRVDHLTTTWSDKAGSPPSG